MSNLPPGTSERDFEIGGPDREWEQDATCPECGTEAVMLHQSHWQRGVWAFCPNPDCEAYDEGFDRPNLVMGIDL